MFTKNIRLRITSIYSSLNTEFKKVAEKLHFFYELIFRREVYPDRGTSIGKPVWDYETLTILSGFFYDQLFLNLSHIIHFLRLYPYILFFISGYNLIFTIYFQVIAL